MMHRFPVLIFGVLFLGVSILHLIACYRRLPKTRTVTKVLLMPLLCVLYCVYTRDVAVSVIGALVSGWIGDMLLLFKHNKVCMLCGIAAFAIGHVCYITAILTAYPVPLNAKILISVALCVLWMVFVCVKLLPYAPKSLRKPGFVYALLLSCTGLSALFKFLCVGKDGFLLAFIGGLFFMLSDTLLTGQQYRKELKHGNFYVMLTYIIAQTLLVLGLAQTGGF